MGLQQIFSAIAFAEENEHDTALNLMSNTDKTPILEILGKKIGKFRKTVDSYQERITFAEAGNFELVDDYPIEDIEDIQKNLPVKLLVVGNEASFSDSVIKYAIDMAKRMSYDILALNTAPFACVNLFSSHQKKLCNDFTELARENIISFKEKALESGLEFRHVIMFDSVDEAQEKIFKEHKDIAFVISNEIEDRSYVSEREGIQDRVFVYSMINDL